MAIKDLNQVLTELKTLVGEELKCVTYKWISRHYDVSTNVAKQILFNFADSHRGKINVTYLLAGWTKANEQHIFQILDEKNVQEAKKKLASVTSMHVYSVQPSQPKDASDLWNADTEQASALFDNMVKKMEQNCLWENRLSSIYCAEARRDPELAKKVPAPPMPEQMEVKQSKKVADKLDSIIAGSVADKKGVASTSMTVAGDRGQETKDSLTKGPNSAPAAGAKGKQTGKKGSNSQVAKMWGNAPPKSQKQAAKSAPQAKMKAKVEAKENNTKAAASNSNNEDESSEESDEEEQIGSTKRKASNQAVLDDESESEAEEPAPSKSKAKQKGVSKKKAEKPAAKKSKAVVSDDSEDDIEIGVSDEDASQPAKDSQASKQGAKGKASAASKKKEAPRPAFGSVKSGPATGSKRRKVTRTVINSKGEEVTEEVWEEETADVEGADVDKTDPPARQEDEAEKPPAQSKAAAKKPSPAKAVPKKPAASGKGKPAGQKGIMSFFAKK